MKCAIVLYIAIIKCTALERQATFQMKKSISRIISYLTIFQKMTNGFTEHGLSEFH